jgi:hypothetical protein
MIHPEDYRLILAMLGVQDIPAGLEDEYALRLSMFHRSGNQGPLGAIGLIGMIRDLGHVPAAVAAQQPRIDWSRYPVNGRIRVEAKSSSGNWLLGVYNGMSGPGELAIKIDDDPYVRTFLARDVRLAADQTPPKSDTEKNDMMSSSDNPEKPSTVDHPIPPAVESVIDTDIDEESEDELIGNDEPTEFIPAHRSMSLDKRGPQIVCDEPDDQEAAPAPVSFDWSTVMLGSGVWVQDEQIGVLEGKLAAVVGDKLSILVDGEAGPRDFDCEICTLGG